MQSQTISKLSKIIGRNSWVCSLWLGKLGPGVPRQTLLQLRWRPAFRSRARAWGRKARHPIQNFRKHPLSDVCAACAWLWRVNAPFNFTPSLLPRLTLSLPWFYPLHLSPETVFQKWLWDNWKVCLGKVVADAVWVLVSAVGQVFIAGEMWSWCRGVYSSPVRPVLLCGSGSCLTNLAWSQEFHPSQGSRELRTIWHDFFLFKLEGIAFAA